MMNNIQSFFTNIIQHQYFEEGLWAVVIVVVIGAIVYAVNDRNDKNNRKGY